MARRILVAEDEPAIAEILRYNLERENFAVDWKERGDAVLPAVREQPPDLLILDLMLPGVDGLEILRALKRDTRTASVPVLVLTARGEEVDRIVGLELGADDYLPKPFSPREVVLRVKAILRRAEPAPVGAGGTLTAGAIRLDVLGHRLHVGESEVRLTATEFRLLRALMEGRGRVKTREQLLSEVWGYADDVDSRTVDTHVRRLRRKLGDHGERVETVIGVGYRFRA